jgi:restriction endonuclease S subunit
MKLDKQIGRMRDNVYEIDMAIDRVNSRQELEKLKKKKKGLLKKIKKLEKRLSGNSQEDYVAPEFF